MSDLTIIYLTANRLPDHWTLFQQGIFQRAAEGHKVITVARQVQTWGDINLLDEGFQSHHNMYVQLLRACKLADTPYIATAEDDVLYSKEHYNFYRPAGDTIAYDMSRWSLYYWTPIFSVKQRISNSTLIAPREEYIDALEERLKKMSPQHPELISEVGRYEANLGVRPRKIQYVYSPVPVVQFNHPNSTDHVAHAARKRLGQLKAIEIPVWGRAEDIIKEYR